MFVKAWSKQDFADIQVPLRWNWRKYSWATWLICILYFHFRVAVHLFFKSSACAKRFTWKWLDFHENEWTGDIHLVLHKDSCNRGESNLELAYSSMSCYWRPLILFQLHWVQKMRLWRWTEKHCNSFKYSDMSIKMSIIERNDLGHGILLHKFKFRWPNWPRVFWQT